MFGDGNAFVSTRSTLIKTAAAAGGAALLSRLGITVWSAKMAKLEDSFRTQADSLVPLNDVGSME